MMEKNSRKLNEVPVSLPSTTRNTTIPFSKTIQNGLIVDSCRSTRGIYISYFYLNRKKIPLSQRRHHAQVNIHALCLALCIHPLLEKVTMYDWSKKKKLLVASNSIPAKWLVSLLLACLIIHVIPYMKFCQIYIDHISQLYGRTVMLQ